MLPFPELKQPTVLDPTDCRLVMGSYQQWLMDKLQRHGVSVDEFNEFNATLNGLRHLHYTTRWLTMIGLTSPLAELASSAEAMASRAPQLTHVKELEGDLFMLIAETAEPSIRAFKKGGDPRSPADIPAIALGPLANISTLEKVRELYALASVIYARCATSILKMMEATTETDPQRTQYVLVDQYMVKYLGAVGRTLLMDLALWIEERHNDASIPVASAAEVLTLVARYPEARTVLRDETLRFPFDVIAYGSGHEFNTATLAVAFFTNAAIIAAVVGDFAAARRSCSIAHTLAGGELPPQLREFNRLIEKLNPQAHA